MNKKFKIAIPELPIDRSELPPQIFEECELLEGDKDVRGDNSQLIRYLDQADAIIFNSSNDITAELMQAAPRLKVVFKSGAWPENVDFAFAKSHGIAVGWTPVANSLSVAEYTILLMLSSLRCFPPALKVLEGGGWRNQCAVGRDLCGMTVGTVGFGAIARHIAKMLGGFQVKMIAYDPYVRDEVFEQAGVERVGFEELLGRADIVSIHCLLTDETRGMFNREALAKMKSSAILINEARGGVIDEAALCEALESGTIAGAALDVFAGEPPALDHPFRKLDNIIMSPHFAAHTKEAAYRECTWSIQGALDYLQGRTIENATVIFPD